jgi:hypothetical protein
LHWTDKEQTLVVKTEKITPTHRYEDNIKIWSGLILISMGSSSKFCGSGIPFRYHKHLQVSRTGK